MNWKKILYITAVAVLLFIGIISVFMYKIGDRIFDEVIEQQIAIIEKKSGLSIPDPPSTPLTGGQASSNDPAADSKSEEQKSTQTQKETVPKTPVIIPESSETPKYTVDELQKLKVEVNPLDKMAVAGMILKRLTNEDISLLTQLAEGGITKEEEAEAKKIVLKRFTDEEIKTIRDLYYKYVK